MGGKLGTRRLKNKKQKTVYLKLACLILLVDLKLARESIMHMGRARLDQS
jgi:hypothetical protein